VFSYSEIAISAQQSAFRKGSYQRSAISFQFSVLDFRLQTPDSGLPTLDWLSVTHRDLEVCVHGFTGNAFMRGTDPKNEGLTPDSYPARQVQWCYFAGAVTCKNNGRRLNPSFGNQTISMNDFGELTSCYA